jgi:hypothetical protein
MAHAIAEYNSGRMKLATAAKQSVIPRNFDTKMQQITMMMATEFITVS